MTWDLWRVLAALAILIATIYGLTQAVAFGKVQILGLMKGLSAESIITAVNQHWLTALVVIVGTAIGAWLVGKRYNFDSPPMVTQNSPHARTQAWMLLVIVFAFIVVVNIMNVVIGNVSQNFTNALNAKQEAEYWKWLYCYAMIFVVGIPIVGTNRWVRTILGAHWRRWQTFHLTERYFSTATRAYYYINGRPDIDNPDERVHEDVRNFCDAALALLITIIGALITLVAFSRELWEMSQSLTGVVIGYSLLGTLITWWLGRKLAFLNGLQLRYEANFRFSLTRVRENTESIAFYGGEDKELAQAKGRFALLYRNFRKLVGTQRNLGFFTTGFDYVVIILPSLFLAPLYFKGEMDIGSITKATFAFRMVLGALEVIILEFGSIMRFKANIDRIGSFVEALDRPIATESQERIVTVFGDTIKFVNVTVRTPDGVKTLVVDLNFEIKPGRSMLVVGPSGSGKSSVLRVEAGLWTQGHGVVTRPEQRRGQNNILFLSQEAYMTLGPFKEQITYPNVDAQLSVQELKDILARVNLAHKLDDIRKALAKLRNVNPASLNDEEVFDCEMNWADIFSPGEQQRLALARLLVFKPKVAILDEATSALDVRNEANVYKVLRKTGTSYLSVGHRPTLIRHHDEVLELDGQGGYKLYTSAEYAKRLMELEEENDSNPDNEK
jgi:ABC-type uncharacterized transport system, permease and ATPase components